MLLSRAEVAAAPRPGQPAIDVARSYWVASTIVTLFSLVYLRQPLLVSCARLVPRLDRRSHITSWLSSTGLLPVKYRIQFRTAVFMHQVTAQRWPSYVADLVAFCSSDSQRWSLRAASTRAVIIQRTRTDFVRRAFAVCGWTFGTLSHRRYAPPWPRILHFVDRWRVSWSLTSLFSTNMAISETRPLKTHFYNLACFCLEFIVTSRSIDYAMHSRSLRMIAHFRHTGTVTWTSVSNTWPTNSDERPRHTGHFSSGKIYCDTPVRQQQING